jgi:hypothetical protein
VQPMVPTLIPVGDRVSWQTMPGRLMMPDFAYGLMTMNGFFFYLEKFSMKQTNFHEIVCHINHVTFCPSYFFDNVVNFVKSAFDCIFFY